MANVKLRVTGMTCGHCQAKVEKALRGVIGVYTAVIDLPDGEAEVDFDDDSVTTDQLVAAVAKAGGWSWGSIPIPKRICRGPCATWRPARCSAMIF